ncbi:MAG: pyridoxamine 5'-phosphate oxidase family protein [Deferrisomatales bacterium]|nr:pyridoxamine 5'-phosphate oxidase family protein [Deferrisomatales bacterium]
MNWKAYFERSQGAGFLATAGRGGEVNLAVYSRPRVLTDGTLAFGMADRLTYANLQENPLAVYAFQQKGFRGVRLYLEKVREDDHGPVLEEIRARADDIVGPGTGDSVTHLVCFRVVKALNLVGDGTPAEEPPAAV